MWNMHVVCWYALAQWNLSNQLTSVQYADIAEVQTQSKKILPEHAQYNRYDM